MNAGQLEARRTDALRRYRILDTPPEETFDRITALASEVFDAPHACVSLVDTQRVWFKAAHGLDKREVKREPGLCATTIESGSVHYVEDALADPVTRANSLVQAEGGVRFYAGVALETPDGYRLGTLCVFGPEPRKMTQTQLSLLVKLGGLVMYELDARRARRELERTEKALQQAQRLEALGMVAGGVVHDFNNLLGGVLGNVGLLRLELGEKGDGLELVDEIETITRRAADLAEQILAYAGQNSSGTPAAIDLNELVRETRYMLEAAVHDNTTIETVFDADLPTTLGDSTALRQVVMNLITNASEAYGGDPGSVRITTRRAADGAPLLEVSDDGVGIDQACSERVFEPFFTTKPKGRGLGLAVVRRVVDAHGGAMTVDSKPGQGSTFRLRLPAVDAPAAVRVSEPAWSGQGSVKGAVLAVDDEESILRVIRRSCERSGVRIHTALNGAEALRVVAEPGTDIRTVLLDMSMPGMSGRETLLGLRATLPEARVVLMSGHPESEVRAHFEGLPLDSYLRKPFTVAELMAAVVDSRAQL